jgi:cytochrome c-type biogenesis protein CcmH/NrfF
MAISHFLLFQPPLRVDTASHWFMMQIGMILGFFTAWPVNRRLVEQGTKEKMDYRDHLATMVEQLRREPEQRSRQLAA